MKLEAIVLDFDGVIADTEPLHLQAFRSVLAKIGIPLSTEDYYARYLGFDDESAFRAAAETEGRSLPDDELVQLVAVKARALETVLTTTDVLFRGAVETIRRLAAATPLAIASGALRDEIELVLDRYDLLRLFDAIVAAGEVAAGKPAPDPYLRAAHLLGVAAPSCIAVEDSAPGLLAARAAGMKTVAVTTSRPASELAIADLILPGLAQVTEEALSRLMKP